MLNGTNINHRQLSENRTSQTKQLTLMKIWRSNINAIWSVSEKIYAATNRGHTAW